MSADRAIVLKAYAAGDPNPDMFEMVDLARPEPAEGQALARTLWLSMDPFPRMQMTGAAGGPPQLPLGAVVIGRGVARVTQSRRADLADGDLVVCDPGWRDWSLVTGPVRKMPDEASARAALGVLGPSGLTAHFALSDVAGLRADDVVAVSAAAGSVGSTAVQLARIGGARVIAIASGPEQCAYVRDLGAEAVIDRLETDDLRASLSALSPDGVSVGLDTVGGATFEAMLAAARPRARIVLAGFISAYGGDRPRYVDPYALIFKRAQITGFLLADHRDKTLEAEAHLEALFAAGRLVAREAVTDGLENAPRAFADLFRSAPPGKQLVRVAS